MSSMHEYMIKKGASVVSAASSSRQPITLSAPVALGSKNSEAHNLAVAAREKQFKAHKLDMNSLQPVTAEPQPEAPVQEVEVQPATRRRKAAKAIEASDSQGPAKEAASDRSVAVHFDLSIGRITNLVAAVIVNGNSLSIWRRSDDIQGFSPAADTEVDIVFNGTRYHCWCPGIVIDNPEYNCSVSVFLLMP